MRIRQRCEHGNKQRPVHLIANGETITTTVEGKSILLACTYLALAFEHLLESARSEV
jgi:hypothetical protein